MNDRDRCFILIGICVTVAALLVLPVTSMAVTINKVEGTLVHGQNVTVSGEGFGVKTPVAPVLWDNFESGGVSSGWTEIDSLWSVYGGAGQMLGSNYSLRADRSKSASIELLKEYDISDKLYIHVKRRWDFSMVGRNQKFLRSTRTLTVVVDINFIEG